MTQERGSSAQLLARRGGGWRGRSPSGVVALTCGLLLELGAAPRARGVGSVAAPSPLLPRQATYRAALLSAVLPGAGEYYIGHTSRALLMGTLEGAVWTSYITFRVQE